MRLTCDMHRSVSSPSYAVRDPWIGFGLSGVFSLHARGEDHVIHPGIAAIFPRGLDYTMSHPNDDGDTSLALGFAPEVVEEALGRPMERIAVSGLDLRMRYAVGLLMSVIERREDRLVVDEMALDLLRLVALRVGRTRAASTAARRRVGRGTDGTGRAGGSTVSHGPWAARRSIWRISSARTPGRACIAISRIFALPSRSGVSRPGRPRSRRSP